MITRRAPFFPPARLRHAAPAGAGSRAPTNIAGCWSSRPDLPFAVQEIYPAGHKGRIHIAGGLLGEGGKRLWAFPTGTSPMIRRPA